MRALLALVLFLAAAPATAQREPEWRTAPEYDVLFRPFAFEPRTIRLQAGQPVVLRFVNGGRATHSFYAPRFFRAARLRRGDEDLALSGRFRLAPGERRTIALVPARGRYPVSSYNFVQRVLGMRALIIVE
jgi:plastocyanin